MSSLPSPCTSYPRSLPAISPIPRREEAERGNPVSVDNDVGRAIEEYPNMASFEPGVYKLPGKTAPFYITPSIDHCGSCGKRPRSRWCKHLIAAGARKGISYEGKVHTASLSQAKDSQRGSKRKSGGKSPRSFDFKPFPGSKEVHVIDFRLEDELEPENETTEEGAKKKTRKGLNESDANAVENALALMKIKKGVVQKKGVKKNKVGEKKNEAGKKKNKAREKQGTQVSSYFSFNQHTSQVPLVMTLTLGGSNGPAQ